MNVGLVFGMIFTVIIIGFVIAYGTGMIGDIFCLTGSAETHKALIDIESMAEEVYNYGFGSSRVYSLALPSGSKICFVDTDDPSTQVYPIRAYNWVPTEAQEIIISNLSRNIWYKDCNGADYTTIERLQPADLKSFCAPGGTELYFENAGSIVEISVR